MKNQYIEVAKRWLEGECFSAEVLEANCDAARDTSRAAHAAYRAECAYHDDAYDAAAYGADAAAYAAYAAAAVAAADAADSSGAAAAYWVRQYEELTK